MEHARIDGRIEIREMLKGLEGKRVIVMLPNGMIQMCDESWYPPGAFAKQSDNNNMIKFLRARPEDPKLAYINPEKIPVWIDTIAESPPDAVIIPYPNTTGQLGSKRFVALYNLSRLGSAFRISLRSWQTNEPKHVYPVIKLITQVGTGKLINTLTLAQGQRMGASYFIPTRTPLPNWRSTARKMLEPHTVRYTHTFED